MAAWRLNVSPRDQPRGGVVPGQPGGVRPRLHVGDLELDRLVRRRSAGRRPGAACAYAHRLVDAALGQPGGQRRDRDPALVEDAAGTGRSRGPARRAGSRPAPGRRRRSARGCPRRTSPPWSSPGATVKPGVPDGTMIVEISLRPSGSTRHRGDRDQGGDVGARVGDERLAAVDDPLVGRSSSTARVRVPPASEPKPGSVRPNAASASPRDQPRQPGRLLLRRCRTGRSAWRRARPPPPA